MKQQHIKEKELELEYLRSILRYEADTGDFYWLERQAGRPSDRPAGGRNSNNYVVIGIKGYQYFANRLAWYYTYGVWPKKELRHKNGKRYDNRLDNLEEISAFELDLKYKEVRKRFNKW